MSKYLKICGAALAAITILGGAALGMGWIEISTTDAVPGAATEPEAEPVEAEEPAEEAAAEEEAKEDE